MRIVHAIYNLDPRSGGPPAVVVGLALAQQRLGIDVCVTGAYRKGADPMLADQLRDAGVQVDVVGPTGYRGSHPDLKRTLAAAVERADILHIHGCWLDVERLIAWEARRQNKPYIIAPHGVLDPWSLRQKRLKKRLAMALYLRRNLNAASALHFCTETERQLVVPLKLKPPTIVEPNGLDLEEFAELPEPGLFRARYPQLGNRPIVLFLSRIHHKKGLDLLVPAFARGAPDEAMLVIAGPDRGEQGNIERLVRDCGIEDRVLFTGMLFGRDRIAAMVDADLFALSSYQENFGIVVIEALAARTPVIISDQVNVSDEIRAANLGAVVPTEVEPLAAALEEWLGDAQRRAEVATRGREYVRERFDWSQIGSRWIDQYRLLIDSHAAKSRRSGATPGRQGGSLISK